MTIVWPLLHHLIEEWRNVTCVFHGLCESSGKACPTVFWLAHVLQCCSSERQFQVCFHEHTEIAEMLPLFVHRIVFGGCLLQLDSSLFHLLRRLVLSHDYIDHFRNVLFMNIAYGYESRSCHGDYLPRHIVHGIASTTVIAQVPVSVWLREVIPWKSDEGLLQVPLPTSRVRYVEKRSYLSLNVNEAVDPYCNRNNSRKNW